MNLLVSDYDGTIYFKDDESYTKKNLNAINELLLTENKFCIATGRNFKSIKEQIDRFSIRYNYLITGCGNVIFDDKNNILSFKLLDKCLVRELVYALRKIDDVYSINLFDVYGNKTDNFFEVMEICIYFNRKIDIKNITEIREIFNYFNYRIHKNKCYFKGDANKSDGVRFVSEKCHIPKSNIFTIGDDIIDKEMIIDYDGFIVPKSYLDDGSLSNPTIKLHELIKEKIL